MMQRQRRAVLHTRVVCVLVHVLIAWEMLANAARAECSSQSLAIPKVAQAAGRAVTLEDISALRHLDTLSVSPDRKRFAVFVRQGDARCNEYRTAWFVGGAHDGSLAYAGDGGEARPLMRPTGHTTGDFGEDQVRWSPDGRWIAYLSRRGGEVQVWRSQLDGSTQSQLTHNAADVLDFAWSEDSTAVYFTVGRPREVLGSIDREKARTGYRFDEDLYFFTDLILPHLRHPRESERSVWTIFLRDGAERLASDAERSELAHAITRASSGVESSDNFLENKRITPVTNGKSLAWLVRAGPLSRNLRLVASLSTETGEKVCTFSECAGVINRVWWSDDGEWVFFWRSEGINEQGNGFYAFSPTKNKVRVLARFLDDDLQQCAPAAGNRAICIRETPTLPAHIAAIDLSHGVVRVLADMNPEFRNIRLGRVERIEWDTPRLAWNEPRGELAGLYPQRAYGYVLYPPDFDRKKRYPVFIDPYTAHGFNRSGDEHPIRVYAAQGFVVLNTAFPMPTDILQRLGSHAMAQLYSEKLDFPHLTMLMESTVKALEMTARRGFIDDRRVGIGGVSHGSFVPLYMLQKHDLIRAISISSPSWGPHEYYWGTLKGREDISAAYGQAGNEDWRPKPTGAGAEFWSRIDIADHVDAIEAPVLMQLADQETYAVIRLIRHLADAGKPYDAYVFPNETHIKWQPAHLHAAMSRNLDWFRFWLQDYVDPDPMKAPQYKLWNVLREEDRINRERITRTER